MPLIVFHLSEKKHTATKTHDLPIENFADPSALFNKANWQDGARSCAKLGSNQEDAEGSRTQKIRHR